MLDAKVGALHYQLFSCLDQRLASSLQDQRPVEEDLGTFRSAVVSGNEGVA